MKPANPFPWIKAWSDMSTTTTRRRFTLMDAVVLIAAIAVSLVPVRLYLEGPWPPPLTLDDWSLGSLFQPPHPCRALWLIRFRRPIPKA